MGAGRLDRRKFLEAGTAALVGGLLAWRLWPWRRAAGPTTPTRAAPPPAPSPVGLAVVEAAPGDRTRTWPGPSFWANRLQDWWLHQGRLECVAATGPMRSRTVSWNAGSQARSFSSLMCWKAWVTSARSTPGERPGGRWGSSWSPSGASR